jgi:hypothetical protein
LLRFIASACSQNVVRAAASKRIGAAAILVVDFDEVLGGGNALLLLWGSTYVILPLARFHPCEISRFKFK